MSHAAYVNAQRAVAAIGWRMADGSEDYRLGLETMQADAVRAIRAAAEAEPKPTGTMVHVRPGETPAKDLPAGMWIAVCEVLEAYGLQVTDKSLEGRVLTEVIVGLTRVIDATPEQLGGRKVAVGA